MIRKEFLFLISLFFIFLVIATPSFHTIHTNSSLFEDQSPVFEYNFTANVTNTGAETLIFEFVNITSSYLGYHSSDYFSWISLDSSAGIMTFNATLDNQTGRYNISVFVHNPEGQGQSDLFYFFVNATNDYPNFTNISTQYNLSQGVLFSEYLNASDEEKHYPLHFNIEFNSSCVLADWSTRANCTLFLPINFSNSSALMNITPVKNDVGIYYANISVRDFGENYTCVSGYCKSDYSQNKTTYYSQIVVFSVLSFLELNISNCQNKIFQENVSDSCYINITTKGENDVINMSSLGFLRNYPGSVLNSTWFYMSNLTESNSYVQVAFINVTPYKTEVGNWTINFSVSDLTFDEDTTSQIYIYVNRTFNDAPDLVNINDKNTSINLLTRINLTVYDDDLLIPDKLAFNESANFTIQIFNQSNLSQELSINNFSVQFIEIISNRTKSKIEFTPGVADVGDYTINISVNDKDGSFDSDIFNLSIINNEGPSWNESVQSVFVIYEDNNTYLNLTLNVSDPEDDTLNFSFVNSTSFPNFNLTSNGIINFTPRDLDVGEQLVNITISDGYLSASLVFNFTIYNINDDPYLETPITVANGSRDANSNVNATEDNVTTITLWIQDDDFKISSVQKKFYNETLNVSIIIEGPNSTLFHFTTDLTKFPTPSNNRSKYDAVFTPKKADVGNYNITLNITDLSNSSISLRFNLTVFSIEHYPVLMNLSNQTISFNTSFYYRINASDEEDGSSATEGNANLTFIYDFLSGTDFINNNESIFNTTSGELNITFNSSQGGSYNINITVSDSSGMLDSGSFWLFVYDAPLINFPLSSQTFNLVENTSYNLTFYGNHSVGSNLTFMIYIQNSSDSVLRYNISYYGNNTNLTWQFAPNFTDEVVNANLTLLVLNSNFPNLNASQNWNLTINHTNSPVYFIGYIPDSSTTHGSEITINLANYFTDIDYYDVKHNQTLNFSVVSNSTPSYIYPSISNFILTLTSTLPSTLTSLISVTELLNITGFDLDSSNNSLTNATSNNFIIEFIPPSVTTIPSSGGTTVKPTAFKIITPGKISGYAQQKIIIPLSLVNSGKQGFYDINLTTAAYYNGSIFNKVRTSFDESFVSYLGIGEYKNLTLTVFFDTNESGDYEILINATSKKPRYTDWAKIYINLQPLNKTADFILFTEEFIAENPECKEIEEIVNLAKEYFAKGDLVNAKLKSEEAVKACEEAISQPGLFSLKFSLTDMGFLEYLAIAILFFLVFGVVIYFAQRRRFRKKISYREFVKK